MSSGSIKFLGTADGMPSAERNHASILIGLGHRRYLFDCGEPVSRALKQSGIPFEAIDRLFVSHLHADHCGGLPMLVQSCWLENRQKPLPVHMPAEGIRPYHSLLQAMYLFDDLLPFALTLHPLKAAQPIVDAGIEVIPHPSTHLRQTEQDHGRRHKVGFEAFCFEIRDSHGMRIGYSADLGSPIDLDPLVAAPLDVLIVELAHFTAAALFAYLQDKPVRKILLTHMGRKNWKNPEVQAVAKEYCADREVVIAADGLEVAI